MRTVEIEVFTIDELSDTAKEKAWGNWIQSGPYFFYGDELKDTLDAFEDRFPINVTSWSYGGRGSHVSYRFEYEEEIEQLSGWRLATYLWNNHRYDIYSRKYYGKLVDDATAKYGKRHVKRYSKVFLIEGNCPLTGVCYDASILKPIHEFMKDPDDRTFGDLLQDCLEEWRLTAERERDYFYSQESFEEECRASEREFKANGEQL